MWVLFLIFIAPFVFALVFGVKEWYDKNIGPKLKEQKKRKEYLALIPSKYSRLDNNHLNRIYFDLLDIQEKIIEYKKASEKSVRLRGDAQFESLLNAVGLGDLITKKIKKMPIHIVEKYIELDIDYLKTFEVTKK